MKITKVRLRQIIKEEISAVTEQSDPEEEIYVALVNHAGDKMRHALEELNLDIGGAEDLVRSALMNMVKDAIEEASAAELGSGDEEESGTEWDERSYQMDLDDRAMDAGAWQGED